MKKLIVLSLMLLALSSVTVLQAQVNIGGDPVSYGYEGRELLVGNEEDLILEPLVFVQTAPIDMAVVEAEDAQWEAERAAGMMKIGRRFGIEFEVAYDVHNSGTWTCLPDGGRLWRLGVECPEALSINLIFDQYRLPSGATLYIYSEDKRDKIGGFTDYNNQADNFFATDVVLSDKIVIEYFQPVDADFDGELRLATIVHGYRGPGEFTRSFGQSGSCQRNTICPEGEGWEDQIRSVFALYSGGMELCSGAIVNNTANDGTPYALTANHCWNAAQNTGNWVFRFNWESPTCTPTANSSYKTMSGSVLRMKTPTGSSATDCCLVELNTAIPEDYNVYYAGWSRSTTPSPSGMCIHHPNLDIKKISPSKPLYTVSYPVGYSGSIQAWRADWSTGACTEPGSSGSPLFDSDYRIVGQEYGGGSACNTYGTNNHFDVYGRFDVSWNYGTSSATRLKDWLDPLNLDPTTWDGHDPNSGPATVDAELLDIIIPEETYYFTETIEPKVTIKNNGDADITAATVSYTIDGSEAVSKAWTGSLAVDATADITFDPITLTYGIHVFKATVTVADDANPDNDSKTKDYEVQDCLLDGTYLQEDFEEGELPDCWQNIAVSGARIWTFVESENNGKGNPSGARSGSYNALFQSDTVGNVARLITPPMNIADASMPQPVLTFWYAQANNDNKQDKLRIYYKNAPDATWKRIKEFSDDVSSWTKEDILLTEPSETYWIAFEGASAGGSGVVLDNISIAQAAECSPIQNLTAEQNGNEITINWEAPENTEDVKGYAVYVNGTEAGTVTELSFTFSDTELIEEYEFCVVAVYGYEWCEESLPICILFQPVSIGELQNNSVQIYPNPAHTHIFVEGDDIETVEIYNLQGKLLYAQKGDVRKIDVSDYASGTYLVKVSTKNGKKTTKQITIIP